MDTSKRSDVPDDLISPREASQVLGVHLASIYRFIEDGRLPAWRRAGTRWRVSKAAVLGLLVPPANVPEGRQPTHAEAMAELRRRGWL